MTRRFAAPGVLSPNDAQPARARARHGVELPHRTPPLAGLAVLTAEQVAELAYDAAATALAEFTNERTLPPELVDGVAMARLISVSRATLHRLRISGMPAIAVGDTFRYRPATVIAWLEQRGSK